MLAYFDDIFVCSRINNNYYEVHHTGNKEYVGDFIRNDDGYFVFFQNRNPAAGYVDAAYLRAIADKLDDMNAEWEAQLTSFFEDKDEE